MLYFINDYSEGAHPKILEALAKTNNEHLLGYGADEYTQSAKKKICAFLGKDIDDIQDRTVGSKRREDIKLEVKHLSYMGPAVDISFTAYGGEVLGIGGLVGSGRTEILQALYGTMKRTNGEVTLNGERIGTNVKKNIKKGFAYVPEDRRGEGFIPLLSIEKNLNIANYDRTAPAGWVSRSRARHNRVFSPPESRLAGWVSRPRAKPSPARTPWMRLGHS